GVHGPSHRGEAQVAAGQAPRNPAHPVATRQRPPAAARGAAAAASAQGGNHQALANRHGQGPPPHRARGGAAGPLLSAGAMGTGTANSERAPRRGGPLLSPGPSPVAAATAEVRLLDGR